MRILLLVESCATGVGRHVLDLSRYLCSRGNAVHLIYSPLRIDQQFQSGLHDVITRYAQFRALSLSVRHWPSIEDASAIRTLRSYVQSKGPFHVLHCHSTKAGFLARVSLLRSWIPIVYTPHAAVTMNPGCNPFLRLLARFGERALATCCDAVIAVSSKEFKHLRQIGISDAKLIAVRNGIGSTPLQLAFQNRIADKGGNHGHLTIGFVGRIVPQKRVDVLLRAYAHLEPQLRESCSLTVVGDGPLVPHLMSLAHALGIGSRVNWLGHLDGQAIMNSFDVFCLPSDFEGFPYVLLEAMAAGLPVVATDVGGVEEMVRHGANGLVVPVGQPKALSQALTTLLRNRSVRMRMGRSALDRVNEFTVEKMGDTTLRLYENLHAKRQGRKAA